MKILSFIPQNGLWLYALISLLVLLLIQLFYYLFFYTRLGGYIKKTTNTPAKDFAYPPFSIIICARNESQNLLRNLPAVLQQDYPASFEVVVVNDASVDDSAEVLTRLKTKYNHLYSTHIPYDEKFRHGKKLALTIGVRAAKHEHLLFTDADCEPAGKYWLKTMAQGFSDGKELVLGVGAHKKEKGFINLWQRYDTFQIAVQYLSFALRGVPYMGVGRNIAYKKSLFLKNGGFRKHQHMLSGDDDLFVRDTATRHNVAIVCDPQSFTFSESVKNFTEWKHQKRRHLTTSPFYKSGIKFLLGLEAIARQLFWGIALFSVFFSNFALIFIGVIITKLAIQFLTQRRLAKHFGHGDLLIGGFLLDLTLPFVTGMLLLGIKRQAKNIKWT
ncbi:Glycosyltransferase, catalytic subunit of cellulose synthase and poly-beta-1,6-N-acetylglucosamine synthase [Saccharicrinis carchari]|uniref:Glycosyltransferase, catalytic subunit of cellulose synthase and poly-beta-1,6-N-acetylglucosamine synthase n=1 Tax=Saccharicrinis carchari TaxID=1168039 RepID=A0A521ELV8_SACCC|nr:glycosyltransferase [Saccharicrinis carchari]SMO84907.1 Glycosyltransferase, catalytic subunit of cellulose synthase and poly-beta-1,6-N-acetylglucosamine synthase [Saccharicrinis carchari]